MRRLVLLVVLGIVVSQYFPESKAALYDLLQPVIVPVQRWQTQSEMRDVAVEVQVHERENYGQIPDSRGWPSWLERKLGDDGGADPWGTTYHLYVRRDSFHIVSFGPDGLPGTGDELSESRRAMRPRSG